MSTEDALDIILSVKTMMSERAEAVSSQPVNARNLLLRDFYEYEERRCDTMARLLSFQLDSVDEDIKFILEPPEIPEDLFQGFVKALKGPDRELYEDFMRLLTRIVITVPYYRTGLSMAPILARGDSPLKESKIFSLVDCRDILEEVSAGDIEDPAIIDYIEYCLEEISLVIRACTAKEMDEDESVFHMQWSWEIDHDACHEAFLNMVDFDDGVLMNAFHRDRMIRWSIIMGSLIAYQVYGDPSTTFEYDDW